MVHLLLTVPVKMAKKPAKSTKHKGFEETLWDSANKLRGSVESSEYKHIVLSLIFLKFISDKFEERRAVIEKEFGADFVDMMDFYTMENVFYLPEESRWSFVLKHAKQNDIAVKIDTALHDIEKNNKQLAGALPDNYFSRLGLDGSKLSALIDTINMISKLSDNGTAGFVLANGSMGSNTSGEGSIRQKIIENDLVDCMIALPGQLFYTTQIPVCLWFLTKNKSSTYSNDPEHGFKGREDATAMDGGSTGNAGAISGLGTYEDKAGFCKAATLDEIKANDYVLTPGRYVGAAEIEDDGILSETKMKELSQTLYQQMQDAEKLDAVIRGNLAQLGYAELTTKTETPE